MSENVLTRVSELKAAAIPEKFEAWLATKAPTDVVGLSCRACECPVANFLHETLPGTPVIGVTTVFLRAGEDTRFLRPSIFIELPRWVYRFASHLDGVATREAGQQVTAAEALDVLSAIKE